MSKTFETPQHENHIITIKRERGTNKYTPGTISIDGKYYSDTVEDPEWDFGYHLDEIMIKYNFSSLSFEERDKIYMEELEQLTSNILSQKKKHYAETAIPPSTFHYHMGHYSNNGSVKWVNAPIIIGVPGFWGILIHSAGSNKSYATADNSSGCVILGKRFNEHDHGTLNNYLPNTKITYYQDFRNKVIQMGGGLGNYVMEDNNCLRTYEKNKVKVSKNTYFIVQIIGGNKSFYKSVQEYQKKYQNKEENKIYTFYKQNVKWVVMEFGKLIKKTNTIIKNLVN